MRALPWLTLTIAGLLEIVWAVALKQADGFTRPLPTTISLVAAALSFFLLSIALESLPVGTAYVVWVGIGAAGVAATGMVALDEQVTLTRLAFLVMILTGVSGLHLTGS